MKYLLPLFLALSWLPVNISAAVAAPSKCSTVLAQTKSSLNKFYSLRTFGIEEKNDGIPPNGRSQHLIFIRGLRAPVKEANMTKRIIASCPKVGSVSFITNGTDEEDRYGLLNGKVQTFKCKDISEPISWGEYGCA
jgi:hypothetical protein